MTDSHYAWHTVLIPYDTFDTVNNVVMLLHGQFVNKSC